MGNTNFKWSLCGHALFSSTCKGENSKFGSFVVRAREPKPPHLHTENSVLRVQGSLNLTFAHTGKFGQILCYTCDVVRMVHEQHDAACSGQRVEWL